jgi:hypothetical protein
MNNTIETIKYKNYELKIEHDYDCHDLLSDHFNYDIKENNPIFISNHRDYSSINTDYKIESFENLDEIKDTYKDYEIYSVNAYIHSGVALSLGSEYPFNCSFDSGLFGFLLVKKTEKMSVESFIKSWSMILNGEIYGYTLDKTILCKSCETSHTENIDSCWGFVGYELKDIIEDINADENIIQGLLKAVKS